jgi:hypothetical protein
MTKQQQLHVIRIMRRVKREKVRNEKQEGRTEREKKGKDEEACATLYYKMEWNGNKYFIFHHRRHCYRDFG